MTRRRLSLCALALGAALLPGLVRTANADEEPKVPEKVKKLLTREGVALLETATHVEVFRIKPRPGPGAGGGQIAGYPITAKGKEKGKEFAAELRKVLYEEKSWTGQAKRCFDPGVVFRIHGEKGSLDVIVCFACTNFRLNVNDNKGAPVVKTGGAFGPDIAPLLKLAKKAFPDDAEIQGLKETGR